MEMQELHALQRQIAHLAANSAQEKKPQILQTMEDLSVGSFIPEFSGSNKSHTVYEVIDAENGAGKMGAWAEDDKIYAAKIKLTAVAKTFYTGSTYFHLENTTWESFIEISKQRFQDIMPDQFHYYFIIILFSVLSDDRSI
jgi:hypothetical protein